MRQLEGFVAEANEHLACRLKCMDEIAVVSVYVDDIVIACESEARLKEFKQYLYRKFDVKCLGKLDHFLGIKVIHNEVSGDAWIG